MDYNIMDGLMDMLQDTLTDQTKHAESIKYFNDSSLKQLSKLVSEVNFKVPYVDNETQRKFYKFSTPVLCIITLFIIMYLVIKNFYRTIRWAIDMAKYKMSQCRCCCKTQQENFIE